MGDKETRVWEEANTWETDWWGSCVNTLGEETKQLVYANRMGLVTTPNASTPYRFDLGGISVLDIGGGPSSLLLKCENVTGKVVDPMSMPDWVKARYTAAGINYRQGKGEDITDTGFDECLCYNVLQHTENPEKIIDNAKRAAKIIRIFEWINTPVNVGHIHTLTEDSLNEWLGGEGKTELIREGGCNGLAYYGVFIGGGQ